MVSGMDLLREHKYLEMWQRYCGYIDLSLQEFMELQHRLLLEQLDLLKACELGRYLMRGARPASVEEFQCQVPFTTYVDYAPYLLERREDVLPAKPHNWQHTSGLSGEAYKWSPTSERTYQEMGTVIWAMLIFSTCKRRYDISVGEKENILYALAPPPYTTGSWARRASIEHPLNFMPPLDVGEDMPFDQRVKAGMKMGVYEGMDLAFGLPSLLVTIGEHLGQRSKGQSLRPLLKHPGALIRVLAALGKSNLARRPLMPKDLWSLKGMAIVGSNASLYREQIKQMWGTDPLDVYGCTEGTVLAMQTWDRQGMTFVPYFNFFEFIPEEERNKESLLPGYKPKTMVLDQVKPGNVYEIVITNLMGGPYVRYRLGDLVQITALRNEKLNIDTPQMAFYSRVNEIIEMVGAARITEQTTWQAMKQSHVPYQEWTIRQEAEAEPFLHLYLELKRKDERGAQEIGCQIHEQLKALMPAYGRAAAQGTIGPLKVTLLPAGSFQDYTDQQRAAGRDLCHLKPPHMSPTDMVLEMLLKRPVQERETHLAATATS